MTATTKHLLQRTDADPNALGSFSIVRKLEQNAAWFKTAEKNLTKNPGRGLIRFGPGRAFFNHPLKP